MLAALFTEDIILKLDRRPVHGRKAAVHKPDHNPDGAGFQLRDLRQSDLDHGPEAKGSFVEEIEKALRRVEHWHQGSITGFRILYRDTDWMGGEVRWDGQHPEILAPQ